MTICIYSKAFLSLIIAASKNPLVVAVIVYFFGKRALTHELAKKRSFDIKFETIRTVTSLKNRMKEANSFYDKAVNTVKLGFKRSASRVVYSTDMLEPRDRKLVEEDLLDAGKTLQNIMPTLLDQLETQVSSEFENNENLTMALDEFSKVVIEFINFYTNMILEENTPLEPSYKFKELDVRKNEKLVSVLVEEIKKARTIWE